MKTKLLTLTIAAVLAWLALASPGFAAFQVLGDDICVVANGAGEFEDEIERARKGELSQSNSTLVNPRKSRPPIKEKYSTQISLEKDADGNAHVAAIALVSDDGCDVRINGTQWLNESGKGHDISTGVRRYGKLLLPGDENRFDIEYSQTFYDPAVLENDLDGLSLVALPIPIDISVKDSSGKMNDRILVKKGETIEVALHPMFWEHDLPGNDRVEWEIGRIDATGNIPNWWSCAEMGAKVSLKMDYSGIFKIRAKINGEYFYYRRHQDVENWDNEEKISTAGDKTLAKSADDFVGVYTRDIQKKIIDLSYSYCECSSEDFSKEKSIDLRPFGCTQPKNNYVGSSKCNIFVFVVLYRCGVDMEKKNQLSVSTFSRYLRPPLAEEWIKEALKDSLGREWAFPTRPEPGMVVGSSAVYNHVGFLDYDGCWISAGSNLVHKCIRLGHPAYKTYSLRSFEHGE